MPDALLDLVGAACDELGIQAPSSVVGSTDAQVQQLLALANREGREAYKAAGPWGGWPRLRTEYTFTLVNGTASYSLPSDFAFMLVETEWDRTKKWQLIGPMSPQEWQVLKSGITLSGPRRRFRLMGNNLIYIDPTPESGDDGTVIAFEYISSGWCQSSGGTAQSAWAADTDTYRLGDDLFVLGLKWRFLRAKGLDYGEEKQQYDREMEQALARCGTARTLALNTRAWDYLRLINNAQIPDTGFGT